MLDLKTLSQLLGLYFGNLGIDRGQQVFLGQRGIAVGLQFGRVVVRAYLGGRGLHVEQRLLEGHLQVFVVGFGNLEGVLRGQQLVFQLRAGKNHHHRIGPHRGARPDQDALHPAIGRGGHQQSVFRNQGSETAHVAQHRSAFDGIRPESRHLHSGGGGLQLGQSDCDPNTGHHQNHDGDHNPDGLLPARAFALYIHFRFRGSEGTGPATFRTTVS